MLPKVLLILALLIVLVPVVAALTQPSTFLIVRTIEIAASPEELFAHANSLERTQAWSPWKKLDPAATYTYSGPSSGPGSRLEWSGNKQIGAGRQTIVESVPSRRVRSHVEFFRPFKGESDAVFALDPIGASTRVSWSLAGKNNLLSKVFCLFVNQDRMLGSSLEEGLTALKTLVEAKPAA